MLDMPGLALLMALQATPQPGLTPNPQTARATPGAPGTALIRGHVLAADSGQPMRKAQVRLSAPELRESRLATTDANGAYEFKEVRAGRYQISASKGSYVGLSYGQDRPTDAPKTLQILDNQTVERLDFALPRGGVITGRIVDEYGEPAPEIAVALQRNQFIQGRRQLVSTGRQATSNDIGEFRLFGISPGQYYLSATWRSQNTGNAAAGEDRTAYAPTYFPGTANASEAQRITIGAGQQIDDVAIMLKRIKAVRVTGTATYSDGKPFAEAFVSVVQTIGFGYSMTSAGRVRPDGTFTLNGLTTGDYILRVQQNGPPNPDNESAMLKITIAGDDVDGIAIVGSKPTVAGGRIVVDPAAAPALPRNLVIAAQSFDMGFAGPPPPPARVADDYTFELRSFPGRMRLNLGAGGPGGPVAGNWAIRAVRVNGVDVTDAGIEFKPNDTIKGLEVELTNTPAILLGDVATARGEVSKDYTAIAFAQDKEKWTPPTRYLSVGRPDQDGRFKISGLPPGEYYIVAVDRLEPGQASDPEFLDRVRASARSFSLNEGETKTFNLRLTTEVSR